MDSRRGHRSDRSDLPPVPGPATSPFVSIAPCTWVKRPNAWNDQVMVLRSEIQAKARRDAITAASTGGAYGEGFVLVSSYGMVSANPAHFVLPDWVREWDYVILDEGHKIRNASTR